MKKFSVTDSAQTDLNGIWNYVARDNPEAADRLLAEIYDACLSLGEMPGIGRRREELARGLRSFAVGNYVILYRPLEEGVEIFRVLHGARNIKTLFSHGDENS